jgi:excisionase family DNA binding protein
MSIQTHSREVMSLLEAADFLGIKPRTLQRWTAERDVPHAKIGGLLKFRRQALLEWLVEQERATMAMTRAHGSRPAPGE